MSEFHYTCHGIRFSSTFPCPELRETDEHPSPDVRISEGDTPEHLEGAARTAARFAVAPGQLLLQVDGVARYWVRDGKEIVMQRHPNAHADDARLFLYGTAFGAVILQQGRVPLHATTVVKDGRAVAFAGPSGAGKSTLAYTLMDRGWKLVCDDVTALEPRVGKLFAQPGFASVKLWRDVLEASETDCSTLAPIRAQIDKYRWEARARFHAEAAPLHAMIGLFRHNEPTLDVRPLRGAEKFVFLARQTYRRQMIKDMAASDRIFGVWAEALREISFWTIRRPRAPMDPRPLADAVEKLLA